MCQVDSAAEPGGYCVRLYRSSIRGGLLPPMLKSFLMRAGSDAFKYLPVRLVPALTSLITVPIFTRAIGAEDYGNFFLISSAVSFAAAIGSAWISSSLVRFYWPSRKQGRLDEYTSTVLWVGLGSLVTVGVVCGLGAWIFREELGTDLIRLVPAGVVFLVVHNLASTLLQVLRAANRASAFALLSVVTTILTTIASVVLVTAFGWGSLGIIVGGVAGSTIVLPFILGQVRTEGSLAPSSVRRTMLREFLSYGVPLVPVGISSWVLVLADRYVIAATRGATEVGLYSVSYGLSEKIMQLVGMPLLITMTPMLMEAYEKHGQRLAQQVQTQFTRYYLIAGLPLVAGLTVGAEPFMRVFTGQEYWLAAPIMPVVSASVMLYQLANIAGTGLGIHKRSTTIMFNTLAAAVFNVIANLLVVPRFGYQGAAYTTLASYILLLALTYLRSRRYMAWQIPWSMIARTALAAVSMAGLLWVVFAEAEPSIGLLVAMLVVGLLTYSAALLLTGSIRSDERAYLMQSVRRTLRPRNKADD